MRYINSCPNWSRELKKHKENAPLPNKLTYQVYPSLNSAQHFLNGKNFMKLFAQSDWIRDLASAMSHPYGLNTGLKNRGQTLSLLKTVIIALKFWRFCQKIYWNEVMRLILGHVSSIDWWQQSLFKQQVITPVVHLMLKNIQY